VTPSVANKVPTRLQRGNIARIAQPQDDGNRLAHVNRAVGWHKTLRRQSCPRRRDGNPRRRHRRRGRGGVVTRLGSGWAPTIVALVLSTPFVVVPATIVSVALAPLARTPTFHASVLPDREMAPWLTLVERNKILGRERVIHGNGRCRAGSQVGHGDHVSHVLSTTTGSG